MSGGDKIELNQADMAAVLQCDLAAHVLKGQAAQLKLLGNPTASEHFLRLVEKLEEFKSKTVQRAQARIRVVGADEMPPSPESA